MEAALPAASGPMPVPSKAAPARALVLASFDSFLKAAKPIGDALAAAGWQVDTRLVRVRAGQVSRRQLSALGYAAPLPAATLAETIAQAGLIDYDAIVLGLDGRRTRAVLAGLRRLSLGGRKTRPLTIALYPGIVFRHQMHGLANRFGADLILFNSPADHAHYEATCAALGVAADRGLCFGATVICASETPRAAPVWPPRTILYAEQPDVPASRIERLYLVDRLIAYARAHPERNLVIKPRHAPGETTLRPTIHHLAGIVRLAERRGLLPANLRLVYEPVERLLDAADLCLTVSSTVALQAAARGIPFAILGDFGVCEDYGTHFFVDSGCLTTFDALEADEQPALRPHWFKRHVLAADANSAALVETIAQWRATQRQAGRACAWPHDPFVALGESFSRYQAADGAQITGLPLRATCRVSPLWARKLRKLMREPRRFFADMAMNWHARLTNTCRRAGDRPRALIQPHFPSMLNQTAKTGFLRLTSFPLDRAGGL
ncbi:MAG: DUF6716 putative glycosyltransferase [Defluviicoccus sp.]